MPGVLLFFFQAEDGIRDWSVTGVQTCALPISTRLLQQPPPGPTSAEISTLPLRRERPRIRFCLLTRGLAARSPVRRRGSRLSRRWNTPMMTATFLFPLRVPASYQELITKRSGVVRSLRLLRGIQACQLHTPTEFTTALRLWGRRIALLVSTAASHMAPQSRRGPLNAADSMATSRYRRSTARYICPTEVAAAVTGWPSPLTTALPGRFELFQTAQPAKAIHPLASRPTAPSITGSLTAMATRRLVSHMIKERLGTLGIPTAVLQRSSTLESRSDFKTQCLQT